MDAETTTETAPMGEEAEPLFSNLDIFLFSLIVGIVVYWFVFRKKPEPVPEFKKIDTQWVIFCSNKNCVWKHTSSFKQYTPGRELFSCWMLFY